jgi:hypothetical protein
VLVDAQVGGEEEQISRGGEQIDKGGREAKERGGKGGDEHEGGGVWERVRGRDDARVRRGVGKGEYSPRTPGTAADKDADAI